MIAHPEVESLTKDVRFIPATEVLIQTRHGTDGRPDLYVLRSRTLRLPADWRGAGFAATSMRAGPEIMGQMCASRR
jgi:hypothetical protein